MQMAETGGYYIILVTISDYLPQDARIEFYSVDGKIIKTKKVKYGWNSVDVKELKTGIYIYRIWDYFSSPLQTSNIKQLSKSIILKKGRIVLE